MAANSKRSPNESPEPPDEGSGPNDIADRLLTLAEVLAELRMRRSWLYEAIADGRFPPGWRIGRRRFWRISEVRAARERLLVPAAPPSIPPLPRPVPSAKTSPRDKPRRDAARPRKKPARDPPRR
jgi:predicted DNA-binding transcriptional regulator AlpA